MFMHFRHNIGYKTSSRTYKSTTSIKNWIIAIIQKLTYDQPIVIANSLWTIHNHDLLTSSFYNKCIILLIVVLSEMEEDVRTHCSISLWNCSHVYSLNTINIKIPFNQEWINSLELILLTFLKSISVHESFSKVSCSILIIESRYNT